MPTVIDRNRIHVTGQLHDSLHLLGPITTININIYLLKKKKIKSNRILILNRSQPRSIILSDKILLIIARVVLCSCIGNL